MPDPTRNVTDSQLRNWVRGERSAPPDREKVAEWLAALDAALARIEAARPVLDAAEEYVEIGGTWSHNVLVRAVDAYRAAPGSAETDTPAMSLNEHAAGEHVSDHADDGHGAETDPSAEPDRKPVRYLASVCDTCEHTYNHHASTGVCERVRYRARENAAYQGVPDMELCPCARFVDKPEHVEVAGTPAAEPAPDGRVRVDRTLAEGESLWLRTPEALVDVSCLVGTQVAVWTDPDHNPVVTCHVPRELAGAGAPTEPRARLLDMDRDAAIEAAQAAARGYELQTGEHGFTEEHTNVAVYAALQHLADLPYPVTLGGAPTEPDDAPDWPAIFAEHVHDDAFCEAFYRAERAYDDARCSCGGVRWVDDEGWEPAFRGDRRQPGGAGRLPCGFCNEGGWDVEDRAALAGAADTEEPTDA